MISYKKVGGLHWLSVGRLRISWCVKRREAKPSKREMVRRAREVETIYTDGVYYFR